MKCVPASRGKQILLEVHAGICGHHAAQGLWSEKPFAKVFTGHRATRCRGGRPQVRRMLVLCSANPFTSTGAPNHPNHLAIHGLGPRHGRTPQKRPRRFHSPTHSSRQVYQMDRGQAHHNLHSEEVVKFFLDIIYRFGVPNCIITDHGTNFTRKKGVNPVDRFGVVLRLQRITRTSATPRPAYLLSRSKMRGLSPWRTMPLARST